MKLSSRSALQRLHSDTTTLARELDLILRQLEDHFGGYPSHTSGTEPDFEGGTEIDPVPLTGVERAAIHNGLGRAHMIDQRIRHLLNVAAESVDEVMRISRPWATTPTQSPQWGWCDLHKMAGYPKERAPHYSQVGNRLEQPRRLCDRCYRRISEKGVQPSKADIRHLETKGHWPPHKKVKA